MSSPEPVHLLFDVMDTLVRDPFHDAMPAFFELSFEAMLEAKDPHAWVDFELARIDEATFFERFFADRRPLDGEAFRAHIEAAYVFLPGIETLLTSLRRRGVTMHALSNYPEWYELIDRKLGLSRYLDRRFVSFELGLRKPDPRIYAQTATALGVTPERCLFIDDRRANCEAARAMGMDAIVFEDAAALTEALRGRGVL